MINDYWLPADMWEHVKIKMSKGEHKSAEYRKLHPLGVVPAL